MAIIPNWVVVVVLLLLTFPPPSHSETEDVRLPLLQFMKFLSRGRTIPLPNFGWNETSDPCSWTGVTCDSESRIVAIFLQGLGLSGHLETRGLCSAQLSLRVLVLTNNSLVGPLQPEIANCANLTHLFLGGNQLQGPVPGSLPLLTKLRRLVIADNSFDGALPRGMWGKMSGLVEFRADNNRIGGEIPGDLAMPNLLGRMAWFDVSNNRLVGQIPSGFANFSASSFDGNPGLCGPPLSVACSPAPAASPAPGPSNHGN
ncbi:unnamed protein product [Linum tenue]|uniref:Leucine-rich repeat-containing N-terminal plant-type domain-containing protein n=1 Tax=Linum tenue TaxID=586396 RepID=A0AAV0HW32_9ROSI|nr:unnamed protein product [Linum tenue]